MIIKGEKYADTRARLKERCGQDISICIQCAKCSAGCPVAASMDLLPHQVIRLLQLGEPGQVSESKTPWVCASCFTCIARCPRELDLSMIMEGVRLNMLRQRGLDGLSPSMLPSMLSGKEMKDLPQQALVGAFRKMTR